MVGRAGEVGGGMKPYMSGVFALLGALIGAMGAIGGQMYESREQNARHFQSLVYQASIEEWKISSSTKTSNQVADGKLTFEEVLVKNLAMAKALRAIAFDDMNEASALQIIDMTFNRMINKAKSKQKELIKEAPPAGEIKKAETYPE